ncbi:MAG TPA: hypothetical protein VKG38_16180 [Solirubrobacteraceae bacterium]|nr:hypothetical protein [Solirubrobacteraceae bacterium]
MRSARTALGLAFAACALGVLAAPALATETTAPPFTASKVNGKGEPYPFPLQLKGVSIGLQEFAFGKIRVTCQHAVPKGFINESPAATIHLTVKFHECTTGPVAIWGQKTEVPMTFKEKSEFTYHYNGFVNNEAEVEMKAKYLGCLVDWASGTIPEKALEKPLNEYTIVRYKNESGKLLIQNKFNGKEGEWSQLGGGACENPEFELTEGESAKYTGSLLIEVPKGKLAGPETGL